MFKPTILAALLFGAGLTACAAPTPLPAPPSVTPPAPTGQVTPVPALPTPAPAPAGPALTVQDESLVRVSLRGDVLIIEPTDPAGTTFMRLRGCPGGCRLTGETGVLLPPAGLHVTVLSGLTVQAHAPLGAWQDAATYR